MRRSGIGEGICKLLIAIAEEKCVERIILYAQLSAEPFYARLGFERQGDVFMEAGIEHVMMIRQI
jgi:predicted GNAT family N-acyltransferase